jgi:hypothetical protein
MRNRKVVLRDGQVWFADRPRRVECWQHAARLVGHEALEAYEAHAPCNIFCAALEIDGRSVNCNSIGATVGTLIEE